MYFTSDLIDEEKDAAGTGQTQLDGKGEGERSQKRDLSQTSYAFVNRHELQTRIGQPRLNL